MSTVTACIAKDLRNSEGNHLHRLKLCESQCTNKAVRTLNGNIDTTEFFYVFKDGSGLRVSIGTHGHLTFIANKGK